ncbi:hypothetical protein AVEN_13029-1 [Araneus ventricosus]|uniref:Uncharacterized protein n=1 Tax=Araneus ventricosus TaxID=182803 RepID=A0A4Y2IJM6_ARAVE|nr:hypothetical protein AVEN_13029-1 [Araneus ventricosus]
MDDNLTDTEHRKRGVDQLSKVRTLLDYPELHPPSSLDNIQSDSEDGDTLPHQDEYSSDFSVDEGPQPFSRSELNDLVRDLGLSKDGSEFLGSRLKNKNLLTPVTSFS